MPNSMPFNPGDKIQRISGMDHPSGMSLGEKYTVSHYSGPYTSITVSEIPHETWDINNFILVSLATETMPKLSLIEKIKLASKAEPEKSFIKAGITTMSGDFTTEGKDAFLSWLLEENKTAFNTDIVQPLLAEKDEEAS